MIRGSCSRAGCSPASAVRACAAAWQRGRHLRREPLRVRSLTLQHAFAAAPAACWASCMPGVSHAFARLPLPSGLNKHCFTMQLRIKASETVCERPRRQQDNCALAWRHALMLLLLRSRFKTPTVGRRASVMARGAVTPDHVRGSRSRCRLTGCGRAGESAPLAAVQYCPGPRQWPRPRRLCRRLCASCMIQTLESCKTMYSKWLVSRICGMQSCRL